MLTTGLRISALLLVALLVLQPVSAQKADSPVRLERDLVTLNVTVTEPDEPGFVTVYPGNASRPLTSNLNYVRGQTIPNAVIVGLGPTGTVDLYTSQTTHIIVDVVGYFA